MEQKPNYIKKFANFLRHENWHENLIPTITIFLESKLSDIDVDNQIMSTTKTVETFLRDSLQQFQGSSTKLNLSGERLLESAVHCHFIRNKEDPLYSLIYWIIKEPRNTSHHEFKLYPFKFLVTTILNADHAIRGIQNLLKSRYEGRFNVEIDEDNKKIRIKEATVYRPDKTPLPTSEKTEGFLRFTNGRTTSFELKPNGDGNLKGEYDYRGVSAGSVNVRVRGVNGNTPFLAASGSWAILTPDYKKCPSCGHSIDVTWLSEGNVVCERCGYRFYIY